MIKKILLLTLVGLLSLLVGCGTPDNGNADGDDQKEEVTFTGSIEEIHEQSALVSIEKGDILKSGNEVYIDLSVAGHITFEVGDKVRVGYDGIINESHPLGINTLFVELIES